MERRLAAILAADVVGYTRLMREDETGTLNALKAHLEECIDPTIAGHKGRIVKLMGDGLLVEFASVVDAVECAVSIQRNKAERNIEVPDGRRLRFRIGINLGDVMIEGDDIYGDGVNVAARVQELAEPGGVCLSRTVHDHVKGKVDLAFEDMGERRVKNIAEPLWVYGMRLEEALATTASGAGEPLPLPDKPSVAVLPFVNMSADADQDFFAEGISEDIITELSKFRSLFVIARNSSFSFKGQSLEIKDIGRKLGVRYVVEGSVRRAGSRVRITAQLIDAVADTHLWAERYDRDLEDIFAVQDEVTQAVVTAIEPTLGSAERARARRKPAKSLDAWELYQRGMWHAYCFTAAENAEAQSLFRRAVDLDPNFAPAQAGLAYALFLSVMLGFGGDPGSSVAAASETARRAIMLDPDDAFGHAILGRVELIRGEHEASIAASEKALALNPNFASAHYGLGLTLTHDGRPEEGLGAVNEAIRLSPRDPMLWGYLLLKGVAFLSMGRYEEALVWIRRGQRQPNPGVRAYVFEVVALAQMDRIGEAQAALQRVMAIKPDFDMTFVVGGSPLSRGVGLERYADALRKAGLPG